MKKTPIKIFILSIALARAGIKLRNEGSYLGILWYLLNPLLMFGLLWGVFSPRLGQDIPDYPLYLLLGIIMFNLFQQATTESTRIICYNHNIIKSINFPREALVSAAILKSLFSHIFEIMLFLIIALFFKAPSITICFYPIVLTLFCLFCFGSSLALSAVAVYFVDLENIWIFVSRLIWFATPIFYAIEGQSRLFIVNLFNPMYYFITIARDLIIYERIPEIWVLAGTALHSALFLLMGLFIFNKLKSKFAEMI